VVVWCGTEAGAVCGISVITAGVCAVIGAGASVVKGLKEQAVLRWGGAGGLVVGEKEQAVEGRVVWCYMSGWDS